MFSSSTVTERGIQEIRKDMEQQNPVYMTIYMSPYIRVASSLDVNNFSINLFLFEVLYDRENSSLTIVSTQMVWRDKV